MNVGFGPRVRPDDEHAAAAELVPVAVEQPRGAMEADGGLTRPRPALDDQGAVRVGRDQPVLVRLDRGDDVAHAPLACALELLEQEVRDGGALEQRPVERLVAEVEDAPAVRAKAAAEGDALRVDGRRRVERPGRRRLPVDHEDLVPVVVDPAPTDVERPRGPVDVEAAEDEAAVGILEGPQPAARPGLERERGDLAVGEPRGSGDRLPHPLELHVGAVDVGLLGGELRMRHGRPRLSRATPQLFLDRSGIEAARGEEHVAVEPEVGELLDEALV
jgi:hypothetical protein